MIVSAVFTKPDEMIKHARENPDGRAFYPLRIKEIGATRPLLDAGIVNVADNGNAKSFGGVGLNDECRVKNEEWNCQWDMSSRFIPGLSLSLFLISVH